MKTAARTCLAAVGVFLAAAWAAADSTTPEDLPRYPDVSVMVVVAQRQAVGRTNPAETVLARAFIGAGYRVIDQAQVAAVRDWGLVDEILRDPAGARSRELAARYKAALLVVGRAESDTAGRIEGLETARGRLELKVIVPSTGQVIFADAVTESGADTTRELAQVSAIENAARRLAPRVVQAVGEATGGPTLVPGMEGEGRLAGTGSRGPRRLRVAIAPFDDRSGWRRGNWDLRQAIPDLIAKELLKLGVVDVVDRASLDKTLAEQKLDLSGLVDRTVDRRELGTLQAADLLVVGRISEFTTKKQTIGGIWPWKVGAGIQREKGIVKIFLKVIDVRTGRVLAAGEATGEATAAGIVGGYAGIVFGGAQFDKSAMGRATRRAVSQAVRLIASSLAAAGAPVRVCPHCGAAVPDDARFCPQCGKRLVPDRAADRCPRCGAKLPPAARYCPQCGARVGK